MSKQSPFPRDEKTNTISLPPDTEKEIAQLVSNGDIIQAMQKTMALTGAGLKVAKKYVDGLKNQQAKKPGADPLDSVTERGKIQEEILKAIEFNDGIFPRKALKMAIEHREQITPTLLNVLEQTKLNAEKLLDQQNYMAHIYALFLLAQFREKQAYPLIVNFFSLPGEISIDLSGDVVTEGLHRILASVSCGDIRLITALVEDEQANEYVRSAALEGLVALVACGEKLRDEIVAYFKSLYQEKLERTPSQLWNILVTCSVYLYPEEVYDDIKKSYNEHLVDAFFVSLNDVEEALEAGKEETLKVLPRERYQLVEDTIGEMEWWACFKQKKKHRRKNTKKLNRRSDSVPIVNEGEKRGRNDPCWCGSGRKYKKCHLAEDQASLHQGKNRS